MSSRISCYIFISSLGDASGRCASMSCDTDIRDICDDKLLAFGFETLTSFLSMEASVNGSQSKMLLVTDCKMVMSFDR